jgi:hypothetical protein
MSISKRLASIFTVAALAGGITYSGASYVKYIVDTDSPTFIAKGIEREKRTCSTNWRNSNLNKNNPPEMREDELQECAERRFKNLPLQTKGLELFMISAVSIFGGIGGNYIYNALTGRKEDEPELDEQSPVI